MTLDLITGGIAVLAGMVAAIILLIIISVPLCSILNVTAGFSTGSKKLQATGKAAGKALVVYDVGLSGSAMKMAAKISDDLNERGYEVELAGVRSAAAAEVAGYDVVVAGGPIYSSTVSKSIRAYLKAPALGGGKKVGAFARGWGNVFPDPFPGAVPLKSVLVVAEFRVRDKSRRDFVERLLK